MSTRLHLDPQAYGEHADPYLKDEEALTLEELITRILVERKSFLNVTEDSLKHEIETKAAEVEEPEDEPPSSIDVFQQQKLELAAQIGLALNETSLSLDFVSLLLSAVKPNVGKATMSPHLNKNIPLGSLGADRLLDDENRKSSSDNKIGYGWKYQAVSNITDMFRRASTGLNEQILKEQKYWNTVNTVVAHDEVLFGLRDPATGARAIGVKYGYGDSGSSHHDQGLAVLRKDEHGEVKFAPVLNTKSGYRNTSKTYKYIRVKILSKIDDDYMLTGQLKFGGWKKASQHEVVDDIHKARYFLFEEDLFHHLTREAKTLINYSVTIISNKIILEAGRDIIEIEAVVFDEDDDLEMYQNINAASSMNNGRAQAILTFLKLMLCCYYNYNLSLRQKVPTSVTKWKQHNTHPLVLRPLLGHIRHEANVTTLDTMLRNIMRPYQHEILVHRYPHVVGGGDVASIFQKSTERPKSSIVCEVHNGKGEVLRTHTDISASEVYANLVLHTTIVRYESIDTFTQNKHGINVLQATFTDFSDADECIRWTVEKFVTEGAV